jgi:hypothetical protein
MVPEVGTEEQPGPTDLRSPVPLPQIDGVGTVAAPVSSLETSKKPRSPFLSRLEWKEPFCELARLEDSSGRTIVKGS